MPEAPQLGGHFRAEFEPPGFQLDFVQDRHAKSLISRGLIRDPGLIQEIRGGRENPVGEAVLPGHAHGFTQEPGAVDDIRLPRQNRREQVRVIARIVFEVPILDQHDISCSHRNPRADSGALAEIPREMTGDDDSGFGALPQHPAGSVRRTVVDHDDLPGTAAGKGRVANPRQHLVESAELVIDGDDDRNLHGFSSTATSDWPNGGRTTRSTRANAGTR